MSTIFSKIIAGEIPAYKIYEDEYVLAFLDVRPFSKGHTLIVPKIEIDHFTDVPEPYFSAIFDVAKVIGDAMLRGLGCLRVSLHTEGFEVPHFHLHLIPLYTRGNLNLSERLSVDDDEMEVLQQSLIEKLDLS